jgi:hypothetical protein
MLEMFFVGTFIAGVIAYGRWLERQEEKPGRKQGIDGGGSYVGDTGGFSWFGGSDGGWSTSGDCAGGDGGGGCDGGGGGGD